MGIRAVEPFQTSISDDLSDSDWSRLDSLILRLEALYRTGQSPDLHDHVPPPGDTLRRFVLAEIVKVDLEQQFRNGHPKRMEQYLVEWPELANDQPAVRELVAFECETAAVYETPLDQQELDRRFPAMAQQLDLAAINASARQEVDIARYRREIAETRGISEDPSSPSHNAVVPLAPGDKLGDYEIRKRLGMGGMGTVFLAFDTVLQREVALKIPRFDVASTMDAPDRFLDEARAAARIGHPNVCQIYSAGQIDSMHFIAMALVEGQTLAEWLQGRHLTCRDAAEIVRKLAEAVSAVHKQSILHRDIKPHNVMMNRGGEPVLMDFGLARRSVDASDPKAASMLGTLPYMSPEVASGERAGAAADIYGLGVVLYQLLTGRAPYDTNDKNLREQIVRGSADPPRKFRPDADPDLERICVKAMAREPSARYSSAHEMAEMLSMYVAKRKPAFWLARHAWGLVALLVVLAASGIALAAIAGWKTPLLKLFGSDSHEWSPEATPKTALDNVPLLPWQRWGDVKNCVVMQFSPDGSTFYALLAANEVFIDGKKQPSRIVSGDAKTGAVQHSVKLDDGWISAPRFAVSQQGAVFVADYYHNRIAIIPRMSEQKIEYLKVTEAPDDEKAWVTELGLSPDGEKLVVYLGGDGRERDLENDRVSVVRLADKTFVEVPLQDEPFRGNLAFSPDSRFAYIGTIKRKSTDPVLYELDLTSPCRITKRVAFPGGSMHRVVANPLDGCLYVSDVAKRRIWTVDPQSFRAKLWLEADGYAPNDLAISPDCQLLAVLCPDSRSALLVDLERRAVRCRIKDVRSGEAVFAPDGSRLFLTSTDNGKVGCVNLPDWGRIVFSSDRAGENYQLYSTDANSSLNATRLTFSKGNDTSPVWSPSGECLAFLSDRTGQPRIYLLDPKQRTSTCLENARPEAATPILRRQLSWSPDGKKIAFVRAAASSIDVVDVQNGKVSALCENSPAPEFSVCSSIAWSHIDNQVWTVWSKSGNAFESVLYRIEPRTKAAQPVPSSLSSDKFYTNLSVSNTNELIAVTTGDCDWDGANDICLMAPTGEITRKLARFEVDGEQLSSAPSWSPNGRYLIYTICSGRFKHLQRLEIQTGRVDQLASGDWDDMTPDVCPK